MTGVQTCALPIWVSKIFIINGNPVTIEVSEEDTVFISVGSMTADFTAGSMEKAPEKVAEKKDSSWALWEKLAKISTEFGNPSVFNSDIDKSKWVSFTVTLKDPLFYNCLRKLQKERREQKDLLQ